MLGGTGRSFEKGGRPTGMFVCSFEGMPACSGSFEARLLERGQLVMRVRHRARRDWFVWWAQPARTVELLGASLGDCRGHRLGFVPRMFRLAFAVLFGIVRSAPWPSRVPPRERPKASVAFSPHLEIAA